MAADTQTGKQVIKTLKYMCSSKHVSSWLSQLAYMHGTTIISVITSTLVFQHIIQLFL